MALPPTVPTSFVPKQPVTTRKRASGNNPFLALSYLILGVAIVACFAVFGYRYYLQNVAKKKAEAVVAAQSQIDQATVTEFIRLRDRFTAANGILDKQVELSQFFRVLENLTLQTVRYDSLKVTVANDRVATVELTGTAQSFNALAAQSAAFSTEKRIKRAIFSGITVKDNRVSFKLTADLDPALLALTPKAAAPAAPPSDSGTTTTP